MVVIIMEIIVFVKERLLGETNTNDEDVPILRCLWREACRVLKNMQKVIRRWYG